MEDKRKEFTDEELVEACVSLKSAIKGAVKLGFILWLINKVIGGTISKKETIIIKEYIILNGGRL